MKFLAKLFPIDALKETVMRFPVSAVCSVGLFVALILAAHEVVDLKVYGEPYARSLAFLVCGFFWFGFLRLLHEAMAWSKAREISIGAVGALIIGAMVYFKSGYAVAFFAALIVPALLLGIAIAPYLRSRDSLSFWFYNRQIWFGAALSILAGGIWGGGISAAIAAIDYLFGVDVDEKIYADIWAFAMVVFAPLYALSWVPHRFEYSEDDCHAPPQLAFLINWVLAPLVVVYMLILYAYFIKIAIVGEIPRGQLSYMIMAFGGVGVLTYLAGWPLRDDGGPFLKPIYKYFFPALIIPVVMQAVSIYMRIDQYGVTEQRYLVVLSTIWMAVLAIAFTFKKPALKFIVGVLAVMLLFAALGPFSAPQIAERSQMARLERVLLANDILVDGKIVKSEADISFEDRRDISSILSFLLRRDNGEVLRPLFGDLDADDRVPYVHEAVRLMGFEYVSHHQVKQTANADFINLVGHRGDDVFDVDGFKVLLNGGHVFLNVKDDKEWRKIWKDNPEIKAEYDGEILTLYREGQRLLFNIDAFAKREIEQDAGSEAREMVMEQSSGAFRGRLVISHIHVRNKDGERRVQNFSFKALVDY